MWVWRDFSHGRKLVGKKSEKFTDSVYSIIVGSDTSGQVKG